MAKNSFVAVTTFNFDDIIKENPKMHNPKWPQIPDYPYIILIIGGSGLRKTTASLNLTNHQLDIGKIHLYAKYKNEP